MSEFMKGVLSGVGGVLLFLALSLLVVFVSARIAEINELDDRERNRLRR